MLVFWYPALPHYTDNLHVGRDACFVSILLWSKA